MTIVITGASGQLGRGVVEHLIRRVDAGTVVAASRHPDAIADLGVATRTADFDDPDGLVGAFDGADRLLIISGDRVGERIRQHTNAVAAAAKAGVGHVFYTSAPRATEDGNPAAVAPEHRATEEALAAADLRYTALRNNLYTDLLVGPLRAAVASGTYATNGGAGATGYVSRADFAEGTAAVLADPADPGRVLEFTAPTTVTGARIAEVAAEITGRPVAYRELTDEEAVAGMVAAGLDRAVAEVLATFGRATREGWFDVANDVLAGYLGRPPVTVAEFLRGAGLS